MASERVRRADAVEPSERLVLERLVLGHGLDDEVAALEVLEARRAGDARRGCRPWPWPRACRGRPSPSSVSRSRPRPRLTSSSLASTKSTGEAGLGRHLHDARAHETAADDTDVLDGHPVALLGSTRSAATAGTRRRLEELAAGGTVVPDDDGRVAVAHAAVGLDLAVHRGPGRRRPGLTDRFIVRGRAPRHGLLARPSRRDARCREEQSSGADRRLRLVGGGRARPRPPQRSSATGAAIALLDAMPTSILVISDQRMHRVRPSAYRDRAETPARS